MIIEGADSVTGAVLSAIARSPDTRTREVLSCLVRHLHEFVREAGLTEEEFQKACGYVNAIGKHTTDTHNEVVLMAGSLGVSTLVCLLNNGHERRPKLPRTCSVHSGVSTRRRLRTAARSSDPPTPGPSCS